MAAAEADIGGIAAHHNLLAFADNVPVLHARVERRLAAAPADGLDLLDGIRPAQQLAAAFKQLAAKIRPQAVANHGNLALIDDIHQLAHLRGIHKVTFIDDNAVNARQVNTAQLLDIAALRHQPAAGAHNGRSVPIFDLRLEHEHPLPALPVVILNHHRVGRLARAHRAVSEIELCHLSVPPVCSHPLHYTLRLRFWQGLLWPENAFLGHGWVMRTAWLLPPGGRVRSAHSNRASMYARTMSTHFCSLMCPVFRQRSYSAASCHWRPVKYLK